MTVMEQDDEHRWTHPVCDMCWRRFEPGRVPSRVVGDRARRCCVCGAWTWAGIYVRGRAGQQGGWSPRLSSCPDWLTL